MNLQLPQIWCAGILEQRYDYLFKIATKMYILCWYAILFGKASAPLPIERELIKSFDSATEAHWNARICRKVCVWNRDKFSEVKTYLNYGQVLWIVYVEGVSPAKQRLKIYLADKFVTSESDAFAIYWCLCYLTYKCQLMCMLLMMQVSSIWTTVI